MSPKNNSEYITVDGVTYNLQTGLPIHTRNRARTTSEIVARTQPKTTAVSPESIQNFAHTTKNAKPYVKQLRKKSTIHKNPAEIEYIPFVLLRGLWPKFNIGLWQLDLLRVIVSPLTWFLAGLPILFLQLRLWRYATPNGYLAQGKAVLNPNHYQNLVHLVMLGIISVGLALFVRAVITATAYFVRIHEFEKTPTTIRTGMRVALGGVLRQTLHFVIHLLIVIALTAGFALAAYQIFVSQNVWLDVNQYPLIIFLTGIWLVAMMLLYGKHALQIGLLTSAPKRTHLQRESLALTMKKPAQIFLNSAVIGLLSILVYGGIIIANWQLSRHYTAANHPPNVWLVVGLVLGIVISLSVLHYLVQNIWSRQYYLLAQQNNIAVTTPIKTKRLIAFIIPSIVLLLLGLIVLLAYVNLTFWLTRPVQYRIQQLQKTIPEEIHFTLPKT